MAMCRSRHALFVFLNANLRGVKIHREALRIFIFYSKWTGFFLHCLGYSSELFSLSRENNTELSVFSMK